MKLRPLSLPQVNMETLVPYGFFWDSGSGSDAVYGYPVFFDINLNVSKTTDMFQSLVDGQYLDPDLTGLVTTTMLLFNPELGLFSLVQVYAKPDPTGGTILDSDMAIFDPDCYDFRHNSNDLVRVVLELVFTVVLVFLLKDECAEFVERFGQGREAGENALAASMRYFGDYKNVIDLTSYIILASAMFNWYQITNANMYFWDVVELRFELYSHGEMGVGRLFELQKAPAASAFELLDKAQRIVNLWASYVTLVGWAIFLLCVQFMKNLDFHPKLGLVTKTFLACGADLLFFCILFAVVHTIYSFVGCILFGNYTSAYADLGTGWLTTFNMMMGNYAPQDDMGQDTSTSLFYWGYIILASTLLLNALLGIILGAYESVNEAANDIKEEDVVSVMMNEVSLV